MKKRLSIVLALAMAFVLTMSTAAMAAPEGSVIISNQITGNINVQELEKDVAITTFGVANQSGVKGYTVDFDLVNATVGDAQEIIVTLYRGGEILQQNTATNKVYDELSELNHLTTPFDAFGTFSYEFWQNDGELKGSAVIPDKAEVQITFTDNSVKTATSTNLTSLHKLAEIFPESLIVLSWPDGNPPDSSTSPFEISVTAELAENVNAVSDVLYIVEVATEDGEIISVVAQDGQELGKEDGYYYWGPEDGFTFDSSIPLTTSFTVTASKGTYAVEIYAIQFRP